jgi:hypothetical protein
MARGRHYGVDMAPNPNLLGFLRQPGLHKDSTCKNTPLVGALFVKSCLHGQSPVCKNVRFVDNNTAFCGQGGTRSLQLTSRAAEEGYPIPHSDGTTWSINGGGGTRYLTLCIGGRGCVLGGGYTPTVPNTD